jgi:hypothetical protein
MKYIYHQRFYFQWFWTAVFAGCSGPYDLHCVMLCTCINAVDEGPASGPTFHIQYQKWDWGYGGGNI